MKTSHLLAALACLALGTQLQAQVPQIINYQGRVAVGSVNFNGTGLFKFALVNTNGTTTYWSNDGTSVAGSQPTNAISLAVTNGLYSVQLGDTALTNMTAVPASVFTNADVRLRIWFNNGTLGSQLLTPDQRIAAVGYAMMAGSVTDGAITSAKIAGGAVGSTQLASGAALTNLNASGQAGVPTGGIVLSTNANDSNLTGAGYAKLTFTTTASGDLWEQKTSATPLAGRSYHTAVWTGTELIVWGGWNGSTYFNDGSRYNPATNTWTPISNVNAPSARYHLTAVWTGSEMIVWGGANGSTTYNTGGRYNPVTDTWTSTTTTNAPASRNDHMAVWTGSKMIIWGGYPNTNTGSRYDPTTDSWSATTTTNAPQGTYAAAAVWTGSEMIVWSGGNGSSYVTTGGRYNPVTDTWAATSTANAPQGTRVWSTNNAVWTGTEMLVWGGGPSNSTFVNTGGRYNPVTNTWASISLINAPAARDYHTNIWNGAEMVAWGGSTPSFVPYGDGARYNPTTDTWSPVITTSAPPARYNHTAIWTGSRMVVFGGQGSGYFNDTFSYLPTPTQTFYFYQKP